MDYFYVFVRTDIPLADQICQTAHACREAGKRFPHPDAANLVLLAVPSREALLEVWAICHNNKINSFVHFEPDDDLKETALCTQVIQKEQRKLFRSLPLWSAPKE